MVRDVTEFAEERRSRILNLLQEQKKVLVNQLSELFGVSGATFAATCEICNEQDC